MSLFDKGHQLHYTRVAAMRQDQSPLTGGDELISDVMDLHPEFDPFWALGELSATPQEVNGTIVNPYIHTALHVLIEKQLDTLVPPEAMNALQHLESSGYSRHEALHQILGIYADIYFTNFRKGLAFEELSYVELLRDLIENGRGLENASGG